MHDRSYRDTGALFFPDFWRLDAMNPLWGLIGWKPDPGRPEDLFQQESGILVIDRWRHWIPLLVLCFVNGHDQAKWYSEVNDGGEKDSYHMIPYFFDISTFQHFKLSHLVQLLRFSDTFPIIVSVPK